MRDTADFESLVRKIVPRIFHYQRVSLCCCNKFKHFSMDRCVVNSFADTFNSFPPNFVRSMRLDEL